MKRTKTTRNRFITFIRNWRVNTAGVLLSFIVLLFFSCKDDAALIGIPKIPRLNTRHLDIPLKASVIQFDGLQTRNTQSDLLVRFMFGRYNDPEFGKIEAKSYFNYAPPDVNTFPTLLAKADSLILQLNFDLYYYGSHQFTTQHLKVFEVLDTLKSENAYYTNSTTNIGSFLGESYFYPNPIDFDNAKTLNSDTDTTNNYNFKVRIPISGPLKDSLLYDFTVDAALYRDWAAFSGKYKGFAVIPGDLSDKVFGINPKFASATGPNSKESKLILYYTDKGTAYKVSYPVFYQANNNLQTINPVTSYTSIVTDRSVGPMGGITSFTEYQPSNGLFYSQGGTALVTKYNLDNFYKAVDTLKNVIFNSAEIVVTPSGDNTPPSSIQFRVLDSLNHFRNPYIDTLINGINTPIIEPYISTLANLSGKEKRQPALTLGQSSSDATIDVRGDLSTQFAVDPTTRVVTSIYVTEFAQQIYNHKTYHRRITNFALMPPETEFYKSVSSLVVQPGATLRIYYSQPVITIQ